MIFYLNIKSWGEMIIPKKNSKLPFTFLTKGLKNQDSNKISVKKTLKVL